jgi:hypothetical protein
VVATDARASCSRWTLRSPPRHQFILSF